MGPNRRGAAFAGPLGGRGACGADPHEQERLKNKHRKRGVGNIKFIAELFQLGMLTEKVRSRPPPPPDPLRQAGGWGSGPRPSPRGLTPRGGWEDTPEGRAGIRAAGARRSRRGSWVTWKTKYFFDRQFKDFWIKESAHRHPRER